MYENKDLYSRKAVAGEIKVHWKKYCPQLYRELLEEGQKALDEAALRRAELTFDTAEILERRGVDPRTAAFEAKGEVALALIV